MNTKLLNTKKTNVEYIVFDLETTGLDKNTNQITEIAAARIDINGKVLKTFHKFVSLYKIDTVPEFITNLTKIDDKLLEEQGENINIVMQEFVKFSQGAILVAQNAKFDIGYLTHYWLYEQKAIYAPLYIDTMILAKIVKPNQSSYKLAKLVEYFDVDYDKDAHHRADYDVEITSKVLAKILAEMKSYNTVNDLIIASNPKMITEKQKNYIISLAKNNQCRKINNIQLLTCSSASVVIDILK